MLEILWRQTIALTVRDVQQKMPALAYTTLMTTLDRLFRKGVLERELRGRAFAYRTQWSRDELLARMAAEEIVRLLPSHESRRPVLSMLVEAVARRDGALLDELEALIQAKRADATDEEPR